MSHRISRRLSFAPTAKVTGPCTHAFMDPPVLDSSMDAVSLSIHPNPRDLVRTLTSLKQFALPKQLSIQGRNILQGLTNSLEILNPSLDFLLVFLGNINLPRIPWPYRYHQVVSGTVARISRPSTVARLSTTPPIARDERATENLPQVRQSAQESHPGLFRLCYPKRFFSCHGPFLILFIQYQYIIDLWTRQSSFCHFSNRSTTSRRWGAENRDPGETEIAYGSGRARSVQRCGMHCTLWSGSSTTRVGSIRLGR